MTRDLPSLAEAKAQAKALRETAAANWNRLGHSQALEQVAHAHGFRDWNGFRAAIESHRPSGWSAGDRVSGHYLSQPFTATVLSAEVLRPGWHRLVLDLDTAVDVVRFDSFSNMRKQIRVEIGPAGHTKERTSDGLPHAVIDPKQSP